MLDWWRKRRDAPPIPQPLWEAVLARYPFLSQRSAPELARVRELAARFLQSKEFHGAHGLVVTDEMALSIAAQAVLPILSLGLGWYDDFVGIVVHPGEVLARRTVTDESGVVHDFAQAVVGEAMDQGPVMLSWADVAQAGHSASDGYNVVIHEFAHKLDLRDGQADGCPPLRSRAARDAWMALMRTQYETFREKVIIAERFGGEPPWLDPYGAEAIDEFFAVACEAYFVNRARFAADFHPLLALFDGFFAAPAS